MSLVSPKYPLPVGSFSKTNPPKNLSLPLRNPLPPKNIKVRFHVWNGGFVSQKHMFVRTSLAILRQSIPQDTVILGHDACRLGIVPRRALAYALRLPPSCAQQRVAPACRAVAVSRRRIALAKADSIRDSRADYTPPTTPCLAKISVPDRRRRSASSPATIPDCCGRTRPTCPNSEIGAGAPLPCRDIVTAKRFRCRRLARFRIATTNRR